jgi:hypothetical protein
MSHKSFFCAVIAVLATFVFLGSCADWFPGATPSPSPSAAVNPGASISPTPTPSGSPVVTPPVGSPIVADHSIVDRFDDIPARYISAIKNMSVIIPGESHSAAYRDGLEYLEQLYPNYTVTVSANNVPDIPPPGEEGTYLRVGTSGCGESGWYANSGAIAGLEAYLDDCNTSGRSLNAVGFGWCWDMSWGNNPSGTPDPVYNVRWAGSSEGGPQGNLIWGLDAADFDLTGNTVCMDTYLNATQTYAAYCAAQGYDTAVMFTTGPVDGYGDENGYQRQLKHDYIRAFAGANPSSVLFDYADILSWSDAGTQNLETWTDGVGTAHQYQMIHADNMLDQGSMPGTGHIGSVGAIRIAKAMWWTLARIAGWDGVSP